jgi:regulator of replication initiation timing
MDIVEKLKDVADKKDIDILAKHLVCHEAANEIESLRQQLAEQTSSKTSSEEYQSWKQIKQESENIKRQISEGLHDSDCAVHNEPAYPNGPCNCILSPRPSVEVLLEALRKLAMLGNEPQLGNSTGNIIAIEALRAYGVKL